jgi:hypothetical protein
MEDDDDNALTILPLPLWAVLLITLFCWPSAYA